MRSTSISFTAIAMILASCAQAQPADGESQGTAPAPDAEIFAAAGFELSDGAWRRCGDPGSISYQPGAITQRGDFNGDGLEDAFVTEGGTYCFGMTGSGYVLVSKQEDGSWQVMSDGIGLPHLLETKGVDGWPDIQVGGPGFCFPVLRWNGADYALHRREYEGEPCQ